MKEERSDKLIREKIEQLVPSEKSTGLNKQASWQKLEAMLPPEQKNKKWIHYAAAAIVLLLSAILFMYRQDERANRLAAKDEITKKETATKQESNIKDLLPPITLKKGKGQSVVKHNTQSAKEVPKNSLQPKQRVQEVDTNNATHLAVSIATNFETPSGQTAIAAIALPKKKLKTVHINETDEQPAATETARQSFTIKVINPLFGSGAHSFIDFDEVLSSDAASSPKKRGELFKASLSN